MNPNKRILNTHITKLWVRILKNYKISTNLSDVQLYTMGAVIIKFSDRFIPNP